MFWYSWRLGTDRRGACSRLMFLTTMVLLAGQLRQEAKIRTVEGSIIGFLLELVGGITKLRTAGAENRAFGRWAGRYAEQIGADRQGAGGTPTGCIGSIAVFPMVIAMVIYLGAIHLDPNRLSTGNFLALSIAAGERDRPRCWPSASRCWDCSISRRCMTGSRPILEARPEFPAAVIEPVRLGGALALSGVSFRYPGAG